MSKYVAKLGEHKHLVVPAILSIESCIVGAQQQKEVWGIKILFQGKEKEIFVFTGPKEQVFEAEKFLVDNLNQCYDSLDNQEK
jgi:hypothetical protein